MTTPSPERIRLTISVTPEVHEVFQRLADSTNVSLSRAMGDWLGDTIEAAEMMANLMAEARAKPKQVMRQLQGLALGLVDTTEEAMEGMRSGQTIGAALRGSPALSALEARAQAGGHGAERRERRPAPVPPSSNTGGKVPQERARGKRT